MSLNFRILTDLERNLIRVDFQRKVGSIGFTLEEALRFKELWNKHIDALIASQTGGNNGRTVKDS